MVHNLSKCRTSLKLDCGPSLCFSEIKSQILQKDQTNLVTKKYALDVAKVGLKAKITEPRVQTGEKLLEIFHLVLN